VQQVTVVVNFSLPVDRKGLQDYETSLHRSGRTGRFGKKGVTVSVVESRDVELVQVREEHFRERPRGSPSLGGGFATADPPPARSPPPRGLCSFFQGFFP